MLKNLHPSLYRQVVDMGFDIKPSYADPVDGYGYDIIHPKFKSFLVISFSNDNGLEYWNIYPDDRDDFIFHQSLHYLAELAVDSECGKSSLNPLQCFILALDVFELTINKLNLNTISTTKKETKMTTSTKIIKNSNLSSAQVAAKITLGKTVNKLLASKLKPHLPAQVMKYAKHPLFDILIANLFNYIIQTKYSDNKKAMFIAESLMDASVLSMTEQFNIDEIIGNFIEEIKLPKLS